MGFDKQFADSAPLTYIILCITKRLKIARALPYHVDIRHNTATVQTFGDRVARKIYLD